MTQMDGAGITSAIKHTYIRLPVSHSMPARCRSRHYMHTYMPPLPLILLSLASPIRPRSALRCRTIPQFPPAALPSSPSSLPTNLSWVGEAVGDELLLESVLEVLLRLAHRVADRRVVDLVVAAGVDDAFGLQQHAGLDTLVEHVCELAELDQPVLVRVDRPERSLDVREARVIVHVRLDDAVLEVALVDDAVAVVVERHEERA